MGYPPEAPLWASEDDYREEMVTHWIRGDESIPDATIAKWIAEAAQRPRKRPTPAASLVPTIAAPDALALSYPQAAAMLGYSVDHFERHVVPDLRVIVKGRRKTVARVVLVDWIEKNSARALKGDR